MYLSRVECKHVQPVCFSLQEFKDVSILCVCVRWSLAATTAIELLRHSHGDSRDFHTPPALVARLVLMIQLLCGKAFARRSTQTTSASTSQGADSSTGSNGSDGPRLLAVVQGITRVVMVPVTLEVDVTVTVVGMKTMAPVVVIRRMMVVSVTRMSGKARPGVARVVVMSCWTLKKRHRARR